MLDFIKLIKYFRELEAAREYMRNMCRRNCMLMSTIAFSTKCSKKQIPMLSVQKQL